MKTIPLSIASLPEAVLTMSVSAFLSEAERHRFFALCKDWLPLLLEVRTVHMNPEQLQRFLHESAYRKKLLQLVGCSEAAPKRKLSTVDWIYLDAKCLSSLQLYVPFFYKLPNNNHSQKHFEKFYQVCPSLRPVVVARNVVTLELHCNHLHMLEYLTVDAGNKIVDFDRFCAQCNNSQILQGMVENNMANKPLRKLRGIRKITILQNNKCSLELIHDCHLELVSFTLCNELSDISMLRDVPSILLSSCANVHDLSPLINAQSVRLVSLANVDLTPLKNIYNVELNNLHSVQDFSILGKVPRLTLSSMESVTNFPVASGLNQEWVFSNLNLQCIKDLGSLNSLITSNCKLGDDIIYLSNLHTLQMQDCFPLYDLSPLSTVKMLSLDNCKSVKDISALKSVEELSLKGCLNVTSIEGLRNVYGASIPQKLMSKKARWWFCGWKNDEEIE